MITVGWLDNSELTGWQQADLIAVGWQHLSHLKCLAGQAQSDESYPIYELIDRGSRIHLISSSERHNWSAEGCKEASPPNYIKLLRGEEQGTNFSLNSFGEETREGAKNINSLLLWFHSFLSDTFQVYPKRFYSARGQPDKRAQLSEPVLSNSRNRTQ